MHNELVSIIIPSYNRENTIFNAVNSLLEQTYHNIEVIVIDDCSSDRTEEVVSGIEDARVRYYRLPKNSGACVARNKGVELAQGEIIAFQDSDDIWHHDKLEKQLTYLKEYSYEFVSCAFNRISTEGTSVHGAMDCPEDQIVLWCKLLNNNWVSTQTIVCYKYCFEKIAFDPNVKRYQDWDLALQAARYFRIGSLNESLVDVFLQDNSITNTVKSEDAKLFVVKKHFSDVDFNKPQMAAQYYKTLADVNRRRSPHTAGKYYRKSFLIEPNSKKLLCWFLCMTGLMKFYRSRI